MNSTESSIRQRLADRFNVDATSRSGGQRWPISSVDSMRTAPDWWRSGTGRLEFVPILLFWHTSRHTRDCAIRQSVNNDERFRTRLTDIRSVGQTTPNFVQALARA